MGSQGSQGALSPAGFRVAPGDSEGCATAAEPHPSASPHQPASNCIQILTGILKGKRDNKHLPEAPVLGTVRENVV